MAVNYADFLTRHENDLRRLAAQDAPSMLTAAEAPASAPAPVTGATSAVIPGAPAAGAAQPASTTINIQTSPASTGAPPAVYAPPPTTAPVTAPRSTNPYAALEEIRARQLDVANDTAQSVQREAGVKADLAQQSAVDIGNTIAETRASIAEARRNHDLNEKEVEESKANTRKLMDTLREEPVELERWEKAVSVVSQVLGAFAVGYLGPVGQAFNIGMRSLSDWAMKDVEDQVARRNRAAGLIEAERGYRAELRKDSGDEADYAHKLAASNGLLIADVLRQQGKLAEAPEIRESAFRMAKQIEGNTLGALEQNEMRKIAERRSAAAGRAKAAKDAAKFDLERRKTEAEINKLNAEAEEKRGKGTGGELPPERGIANSRLFAGADEKQRRDFHADEVTSEELLRQIDELDGLLKVHGTEANWGSNAKVAARMHGLSTSIKLGLKDAKKLGTWDNGSKEVLSDMVGDTDAWFTSGGNVREKLSVIREGVINQQNASARQLGLSPRWQDKAEAEAVRARPPADTRVEMFNPQTGQTLRVPPEREQAAARSGFIRRDRYSVFTGGEVPTVGAKRAPAPAPQAPAQKPISEMTNDEYLAYVAKQSGY